MNKIYLLTAAFAVMASLSGCSDTELASIDTAQEKTPIGFHTVGSQMGSRATIIDNSNLTDYSFNVYAFTRNEDGTDDAVFMGTNDTGLGNGGVKISHDGSKWNYADPTDLKYWPTSSLNFYAVSPASDPILYTWQISPNKKEIRYLSGDEYGDGTFPYTDVMYAIATDKRKTDNGGTVQLQFKHITSQIVFKAKKTSNMNVEIKSIKLHNFETSSVFTIPTDGIDPQRNSWSHNPISNNNGFTVIKDKKIDVKTDATDISTSKPMFLIPQKLNAWNPSHDINTANTNKESYLSIECKISIGNFYKLGSESGYGTLYVPFEADWQPGKRYVYTLIFGGGYDDQGKPILTPINFDASTEDWVAGNTTTGNNINIQQ